MATRLTERVVRHMRAAIEERLLDCLGPEERAVVEGDFAELPVATQDAITELFGLVMRRQLSAWTDWRPWIAAVAGLFLGVLLSLVSRYWAQGTAIYAWLYVDNWTVEYLRSPGARTDLFRTVTAFGLECLALTIWTSTIGSAMRVLSSRTSFITVLIVITAVCFGTSGSETVGRLNPGNAIVFAQPFYGDVLPVAFRLLFVVAPLLWSVWRRSLSWTGSVWRAGLVLLGAVVLTALVGRGPAAATTFGWWSLSTDRPMLNATWWFRRTWQLWVFPLVMVSPAAYVFFHSARRAGQQTLSAR
jgi:hypothetical protein